MNAFISTLEKYDLKCGNSLRRRKLTTLQVNMGNLCNQSCLHCHVDASPGGENIMSRRIVDDILRFLMQYKITTLDITGGAPELNPNFNYFITLSRPLVDKIIVRSNLTVFFEPGREYLPNFFKDNEIHLICSLPCYTKDNVDYQRGGGVFEKSINALHILNDLGFAKDDGLELDLVYNPKGAFLPPGQDNLEKQYKQTLRKDYGISFNRLITITNVPIKRFKDYLKAKGEYERYFNLLKDNFNPLVLDALMCRTFLSVGFDGRLYDCDFNQALGLAILDSKKKLLTIDRLDPNDLDGKEIIIDEHCLSCTAGSGSSCQGELTNGGQRNSLDISTLDNQKEKKDIVKTYYGRVLNNSRDLKTNACCSIDSIAPYHRHILSKIHPEILDRFYGCGSPIPPLLKDLTVLDLGCGTGRDVYLVSYLVGDNGFVIGVDMTNGQLDVARKYKDTQMNGFGFKRCNVDFKKGYIENLKDIGIEDNSIDLIISNCVVNLSTDKPRVFREIFRVLKSGGEIYFSDVFSSRRIPRQLKEDPVIYGECLGGALYIEDFRRILMDVGCPDYRVVSKKRITISDAEVKEKVEGIDLCSMTIRAFKLDDLEDRCEDYGQVAIYLGTIPNHPHKFDLDNHHAFITKKPMLVCGNTASMLKDTRYARHFNVIGNRSTHYGLFQCGPALSKFKGEESGIGESCC